MACGALVFFPSRFYDEKNKTKNISTNPQKGENRKKSSKRRMASNQREVMHTTFTHDEHSTPLLHFSFMLSVLYF